jgi:hypothetical protein
MQSSKTYNKILDDKKRLESIRTNLDEEKEDRHIRFAASQQAEGGGGGGEAEGKEEERAVRCRRWCSLPLSDLVCHYYTCTTIYCIT